MHRLLRSRRSEDDVQGDPLLVYFRSGYYTSLLGGVVVTLTDHQLERESLNLSQPNPKSEK